MGGFKEKIYIVLHFYFPQNVLRNWMEVIKAKFLIQVVKVGDDRSQDEHMVLNEKNRNIGWKRLCGFTS